MIYRFLDSCGITTAVFIYRENLVKYRKNEKKALDTGAFFFYNDLGARKTVFLRPDMNFS